MIRTIFLDIDGPILDGRLRHYQCYSDILIEQGFTPISLDKYWEMKRRKIDRHLQLAASGADEIYDIFLKSWLERIEHECYLVLDRLQPGVVQKLTEWKHVNIKVALITMRNNPIALHRQLESLRLLPIVDKIISVDTSGDAVSDKADAAKGFLKGEKKESILWIGDTEVDIFAARLLGVKVCAVSCGLRTVEYLANLNPDFLVFDLSAVNISEMRHL